MIDDASHLQSELIEIDENLCRAELTASQRTGYTKRRKQIWEALHPVQSQLNVGVVLPFDPNDDPEKDEIQVGTDFPPELKTTGYKSPPQQTQGFASSTAEITGESKATINRHIARADAERTFGATRSLQPGTGTGGTTGTTHVLIVVPAQSLIPCGLDRWNTWNTSKVVTAKRWRKHRGDWREAQEIFSSLNDLLAPLPGWPDLPVLRGYQRQRGGTEGGTNSILKTKNPAFMRVSSHLSIDPTLTKAANSYAVGGFFFGSLPEATMQKAP